MSGIDGQAVPERGALAVVVLTPDAERFRGALMIAMAQVALGGEARVFLQLDAVALLRPALIGPRDAAHNAAGLPPLAALIDDALDSGVAITACQTGLALADLEAAQLDARLDIGGPVGFMSALRQEDRLLFT
jgi:predicted peroxiredoxin